MSEPQFTFSDGAAYERLMGRWSRIAGEQFLGWLALPAGLRWLDAGCGNGAFTEAITARCAPAAITGIDPSEAQIAFARTRPGTREAAYHIGDAQTLPFGEAEFDVAVMGLVIAFVPDPAKAVAELKRVTRPGGTIATYMWDLPGGGVPLSPIYETLKAMNMPAPLPPSAEASRLEALRKLWQDAGFEAVETRIIRITVTFDDFEDFWNSNTAHAGPQAKFIASLPAAAREALRYALRQRLPVQSDGRIAYQSFANAVKGRCPDGQVR